MRESSYPTEAERSGSPSWTRTTILAFKVRHPAVRRRGKMVRPAGFEPASPRLKGEHPGPLDEGRLGAGSENRTHTSWLQAKPRPQHAMPALIWRRVESTILTGMPADRLAGDAGHPPS